MLGNAGGNSITRVVNVVERLKMFEDSTLVRDVGQGQRRGRRLLGGRRGRRCRFGLWRGVIREEATGVKEEREVDLGCGRLGWAEGVGVALEVGEEAPHGGGRQGGRERRAADRRECVCIFGLKRVQGFRWGQLGSQMGRAK
jgi:hypothetical protein